MESSPSRNKAECKAGLTLDNIFYFNSFQSGHLGHFIFFVSGRKHCARSHMDNKGYEVYGV